MSPWKNPETHAVHAGALRLAETVPTAHGVGAIEPSEQELPVGHGKQSSCVLNAVALPNVPAAHGVGTIDPARQ